MVRGCKLSKNTSSMSAADSACIYQCRTTRTTGYKCRGVCSNMQLCGRHWHLFADLLTVLWILFFSSHSLCVLWILFFSSHSSLHLKHFRFYTGVLLEIFWMSSDYMYKWFLWKAFIVKVFTDILSTKLRVITCPVMGCSSHFDVFQVLNH